MAGQPRLFDIAEYAEKAKAALSRLEKTQQPGEVAGKGGKSDVLLAVKDEIKKLLEKGYTSKQIALAFKDDVFGILPKTITEIAIGKRDNKTNATRKAKKTHPRPAPPDASFHAQASTGQTKKNMDPGSFDVKPDREDL